MTWIVPAIAGGLVGCLLVAIPYLLADRRDRRKRTTARPMLSTRELLATSGFSYLPINTQRRLLYDLVLGHPDPIEASAALEAVDRLNAERLSPDVRQ